MDRNSVIGLILIGAILVLFSILNAPTESELAEQKRIKDSIENANRVPEEVEQGRLQEQVTAEKQTTLNAKNDGITADSLRMTGNDSVARLQQESTYGPMFAHAAVGKDEYFFLENELIKAKVASKGGRIVSVELKKYKNYDSTDLYLFHEETSHFGLSYFTRDQRIIPTDELYFETRGQSLLVEGDDQQSLVMRLADATGERYLEYIYTLKGNTYLLDMDVHMVGFDKILDSREEGLVLNWKIDTPTQEKNIENQEKTTTIYYKYKDGDVDYLSETSDEQEDLVASVRWVAFKEQYFTAALIADDHFDKSHADVESKTLEGSTEYVKALSTNLSIPFMPMEDQVFSMSFYFGPLHFQTLERLNIELESLVPLGWGIFGWVNEWVVIPIFNWLDDFNLSYGIIILFLTIIIKLFLFPITYKTYLSSARMKVLKPEISEISEKYKEDPMKKQQAVMALYRKTGVNPFSGCIPMLLQFPILIAMFRFFPASIELRQESFLWAEDLSTYDSIMELPFNIPFYGSHVSLFTLLMAISMIFYTRMNSSMSMGGGAGSEMQAAQMKVMMYLMPIMMLFFFNSYSAGLSYYYLVANLMSMGQQAVIKKWFVNEDAIHQKIEANKKKAGNQKKSRFQKKLEEMAKQKGHKPPKR